MRPGVFVAFFSEGQTPDDELPAVGPLDHVALQDGKLIAERPKGHDAGKGPVANPRVAEAERELARALGSDSGPRRHNHLRVESDEGVFVRFTAFGDKGERNRVPELGPFSTVTVGRDWVEADGLILASRQQVAPKGWKLTKRFGAEYAGAIKPDVAFRSRDATYHPAISPTPPRRATLPLRPAAAAAPAPETPATLAPQTTEAPTRDRPAPSAKATPRIEPPPTVRPQLAESVDPERTLRSRIRTTPLAERSPRVETAALNWIDVLWRGRFVVIGVLTVAIVGYVFATLTGLTPTATAQVRTVGIASTVTAPGWEYTVVGFQRTSTAGEARARGTYVVVRVTCVNRGTEGAQPTTGNFSLVDTSGREYTPLSPQSGVYASSTNTSSSFDWPTSYPVGRRVSVSVVFDIDPSIRGVQFVIQDARARVKLD